MVPFVRGPAKIRLTVSVVIAWLDVSVLLLASLVNSLPRPFNRPPVNTILRVVTVLVDISVRLDAPDPFNVLPENNVSVISTSPPTSICSEVMLPMQLSDNSGRTKYRSDLVVVLDSLHVFVL